MTTATPSALTAAVNLLDPTSLLQTFGVVGVAATLFAETGLLVGFFLPGDSLLFLAGIAASPVAQDIVGVRLSLPLLLLVAPLAAIIGAQLGHHLGSRFGRRLFAKPDSRLFKSAHVARAEAYFDRYGPAKAVILARFVPVVRTLLNPVAGVLQMPPGRFLRWNIIGGLLWTDAILLAGYLAAGTLRDTVGAQNIDRYLLPVIALIVLVSLTPLFIEVLRHRRGRRTAEGAAPIDGGHR
ncbi:DedA family protein [Planotetraspora phitsanulokensis]|uniref:Membrane protein n=1 Tax=Planotetraspora phitsanulokensis TaxID=575192 RepID=A0A8J3XCK2_9ACTN|nr:VTT domain-containing protein [Planotetraspora phitsanulokensis]GII36095.1 membrane protein [Planotetraspora phitsanulokensis]